MLEQLANVEWNIAAPSAVFNDSLLEEIRVDLAWHSDESYPSWQRKLLQFRTNNVPVFDCLTPGACYKHQSSKHMSPYLLNAFEVSLFCSPSLLYSSPKTFRVRLSMIGPLAASTYMQTICSTVNYARLAMMMSHELGHAFQRGRLALAESGLHDVYNCLINQFDGYCPLAGQSEYSVQCVNGTKTADENWADYIAIRLAYSAYERRLAESGLSINNTSPSPAANDGVPHLTYSQWFFIELARSMCVNATDDKMSSTLMKDVHSPTKYRVLGMIRNFPQFDEAFDCNISGEGRASRRCEMV